MSIKPFFIINAYVFLALICFLSLVSLTYSLSMIAFKGCDNEGHFGYLCKLIWRKGKF